MLFMQIEEKDARPQADPDQVFAVMQDISRRNKRNADKHSDENKALAEELRELVAAAYSRSRTFLNYRKGAIVIKAEHVMREDTIQNSKLIAALEEKCIAHDIEVSKLGKHMMFYIK